MASLNKILNKINKAKSAINSIKGISSKLKSLNFTTALDKLGEQAEESKRVLEQRRSSLESQLAASNGEQALAKRNPCTADVELIYPVNDILDNYIVFTCLARKKRGGTNGVNLLSESNVEIMLYVPDGISSSLEVSYESKGKSALGVIMNAFQKTEGGTGAKLKAGVSAAGGAISQAGNQALDGMSGGQMNRNAGLAVNPMKEQTLNGVDFRSFEFVYEFWPKSQQEADMVNEIIYTFRTAMLPDTFGSNEDSKVENYFNYPNKFTAEFEGPIEKTLDGYLEMVCTKCEVDHFNGQKFAVFEGGQPLSTKMTIGFTEMEIMSQENYGKISAFARNGQTFDSKHGVV